MLIIFFVFKSKKHYNLGYKSNNFQLRRITNSILRMGFSNFRNRCVPLKIDVYLFQEPASIQYTFITFRHRYSISFWGGGWKVDQILKHRLSFTVITKILLQPFTKYSRLTLISMWNSAPREKFLISVFQEFFASIGKIFILAGRLGTKLSFYGV